MMRRTLISSMLVICLAGPVLAQQGPAVSEQDARKAADMMAKKFETAYNAGDAAGIVNLFADDGVYMTPVGTAMTDRKAMESAVAGRMKAGWTNETVKVTSAHVAGDSVWFYGEYAIMGTGQNSEKQIGGRYAEVLTRVGPEWRISMLIGNLKPQQDITGMTTTSATGTTPPK